MIFPRSGIYYISGLHSSRQVNRPAMIDTSVTPDDISKIFKSGVITSFLLSGKEYMRTRFRISKYFFYITTRGTLKDGQTQFLRLFLGTHIVSQVAHIMLRDELTQMTSQKKNRNWF
jgi:hypothetical protein